MRSDSILTIINILAALHMQGERERERELGWPPHLTSHLSLAFSVSVPSLVFEASETPPCVRLHSIPWAAQAWQSVLKVSRQPCSVAYTGYKLPAGLLKTTAAEFHSFYSNSTKVSHCFLTLSVASHHLLVSIQGRCVGASIHGTK